MQAAFITHTGGPEMIQVGQQPVPKIDATEVLIKVAAVAVNHVDTFVRSGGFKTAMTFPFVIGRDAVGTVVETGSAVTTIQVGDRVWTNSMGYDGRPGVTSDYAALPVERVFLAPAGVDDLPLIAAVHSAATATILLTAISVVKAGMTVLIEGAAGHVGTKLVQVAKAQGATVIATANPRDFERLTKLGADQVLDYHRDFAAAINTKVQTIVDTSGKVALTTNLALLAQGGTIALITAPANNQFTFNVREFYTQQQHLEGFVISHASLSQLQAAGKLLNQWFAQGRLLDDEIQVLPFSQASRAHQLVETNGTKARVVLVPDELDAE
ncbi:NADPH:quinone reductase [Lactiplantibacillus daowaiensis]|uniref:NADPH:quinone reductase n=1 Tax=Lactiplantibacillus daowaiensis TaxID=2559918 RepID=A0ABW1RZ53_9LACO|nr:NADPH:quinone reductase [Lactiplantibacillus daowaiensis]